MSKYPNIVYDSALFKIVQNFDVETFPSGNNKDSDPEQRLDWQFILVYKPLNSIEAHNASYLNLRMHAFAGVEADSDLQTRERNDVTDAEVVGPATKAH